MLSLVLLVSQTVFVKSGTNGLPLGAFLHAPGFNRFSPGVMTIYSRGTVIIPRVKLGGISGQDAPFANRECRLAGMNAD